jgi:hypothetical protein
MTTLDPSTSVDINVPAGTYNLTQPQSNGDGIILGTATGAKISLLGAGAGSTAIHGDGIHRVIDSDPGVVGGVTVTIKNVTLTGGTDGVFGGGGIIGGSAGAAAQGDAMTIANSVITGNSTTGATNVPGGGVQFSGGQLAITNSVISSNNSNDSGGGGIAYSAFGGLTSTPGFAQPEGLTISGSSITGNTDSNPSIVGNGGAGLAVSSLDPSVVYSITNSTFTNNTVTGGGNLSRGGAIWSQSGVLNVTGSTFTGNAVGSGTNAAGGAVDVTSGTATLTYDRIAGNTGLSATGVNREGGTVTVDQNWWGCNGGPGAIGCNTVSGVSTTKWLTLIAAASPTATTFPNPVTVNASVVDSNLNALTGVTANAFAGLGVTWTGGPGGVLSTTATTLSPTATTSVTFTPNNATFGGASFASAALDNASVPAPFAIDLPPAITSAASATFKTGTSGSFTVVTTGFPKPSISETGALPSGVAFVDNGDGTASLSGTAANLTGGTYPIAITADNGVGSDAVQDFVLTVNQAPAITSAATTTFTVGTAGAFALSTSGFPAVTTLTETGPLPAGVTLTDHGDGTATLAGTPAVGTGGTYPITLTAHSTVTPDATQAFTLTVDEAPAVTTASLPTLAVGTAASVPIATRGFPRPALTITAGALPSGLSLVDNGDGTATLTGTPLASGQFTFTITADNGTQASRAFTLVVDEAPAITSASGAPFTVGAAGVFTVTATGFPTPTITTSAGLPSGVTLTDNDNGTATIAGTPAAGTGGVHIVTLTAANGVGSDATQSFTVTVSEAPAITSTDHATFSVGAAGSVSVLTSGYPTPTLTASAGLPSGVTFTDNGNGTGTIAGTPAAGTGGPHTITLTAANGVAADATQTFTLTVNQAPAITSSDHTTFVVGTSGSFAVTTTGFPAAATITETGALPGGVSLTNNGDGTATLHGTPNAGTGGVYPLVLTASSTVTPDASQSFTLTVNEAPAITSDNSTTFRLGSAGSFTVTTSHAFPTAALTETGALPAGVSFTDNGDGTATLAGTPTATGDFAITLTAGNGVGSADTQSFTLSVVSTPGFTSAAAATFTVGTAGTFTVTTNGIPHPAITATGLRSWLSLADNGDGTATLTGTAPTGSGGTVTFTLHAANGVTPDAAQAFTLTVDEAPAISSADHTAFTVGTAGSFTIATAHAFPIPTLTKTGALPSGVTFSDNGDGTATLAGTPATGTEGSYSLTVTAGNGVGSAATQTFTLAVTTPPTITSADHTTFTVGTAGTFTVTTTPGFPTATTLAESGALPGGVSLTDNGDGTATLAGTPAAGSGGTFALTITAGNGADVTQAFTLTVQERPGFTSAATATFTIGRAGSFTVRTGHAFPAATTLSVTGSLPTGVAFTDNGDGTATIAGTASQPSLGTYPLTLTASNGVAPPVTQAFTLAVVAPGTVALPGTLPPSNGALHGVPRSTTPGEVLHVSATGYAPFASVTVGIYSSPRTLGVTTADATGAILATIILPTDLRGHHTVVAAGSGPTGAARFLTGATTIEPKSANGGGGGGTGSGGGPVTPGGTGNQLPNTGPGIDVAAALWHAALLLVLGAGLTLAGRRRRRV